MKIHPDDNVAVVTVDVLAGEMISAGDDAEIPASEAIPAGHKAALSDIATGTPIVKCGEKIGFAGADIRRGAWVHTHNVTGKDTEG